MKPREPMLRLFCALALSGWLAACSGIQSVLDPLGPHAQQTAAIAWVLFAGGVAIFVLVAVLAVGAIFAPRAFRAALAGNRLIIGGGIIFPVVTLSALLVYSLVAAGGLAGRGASPLRIEVIGEMWWWRVHYLGADGRPQLATANEIRIPAGRDVELTLKSADVIHSFWVPGLAGKLDMIPGRTNVLRISADRAGVLRGQCAEFCGAQHANMAFYVVVVTPAEFDAWYAQQGLSARAPRTPAEERGQAIFVEHCAECHTVRGTPAAGLLGPDLTHVGSRLSLAAGLLPNNAGTMAGWIVSGQHLKPENRMPSFEAFTGADLAALAGYVVSLQ